MPIDIRDLYEPLRQRCRRYPVLDSLAVIHAYMQYLQFKQPLSPQIEIDETVNKTKQPGKHFYEWELEMLAREIVINAPMQAAHSLSRWHEFSTTVNLLKEFENNISERTGPLLEKNILLELYRIAHQQFPWQHHPSSKTLTRYFKIFGDPPMDAIVSASLGISAKELYTLGLAFIGHFMTNFGYQYPGDMSQLGLRSESLRYFVNRFSTPLSTLRHVMARSQSYDEDYAYTFNPLRKFPLVHVAMNGRHHLVAPIPTYLFERFTEGVFYEICNAAGFDMAFGASFQKYVGEVLAVTAPTERFDVLAEHEYHVGKDRKDSIDWIVADKTATIFIECKTKRVRFDAKKVLADSTVLNADLDKMSEFIVQAYKGIVDATAGRYAHWQPTGKPIYPIVVTLEDWYAFTPEIICAIDNNVTKRLRERGIDPNIIEHLPYTIASVDDFEVAIQVIAMNDIESVMSKKTDKQHRMWSMQPFTSGEFKTESKKVRYQLFPSDMDAIHPSLAERHTVKADSAHTIG